MSVDITFLGTGTSAGIPMIGCHCDVCESADPHDQRSRPSVMISSGSTRVLVDTSPELRLQAVANRVDSIDAVVITHAHADHLMGLDDLRRYNVLSGSSLDLWADAKAFETIDRCFGYAFRKPDPEAKTFRPHLIHREISGPFTIGPMTWRPIKLLHGRMPVLGFRVGNLAYCTDVSEIPDESWPLLEGLELLVLDALQYLPHSTHFSLQQAVDVVERVKPKMARFTHIAHALKHKVVNGALPPHIRLAFDGERLEVGA